MKRLSDDLKSSLTAAKLKALCILNDLPTGGNKSDLVSRLLASGLSRDELGIEAEEAVEVVIEAVIEDEPIQPSLSLEDEDTLTPEVEPEVVKPVIESTDNQIVEASLDEVLDAEVLDAEFVTLDEQVKAPKEVETLSTKTKSSSDAATLLDMIKQPKIAAVFVVVLILGAGTWYYFNKQLEPFTADTLRYGDEMTYTISDDS